MMDVGAHPSELDWAKHLSREGSPLERRRLSRHLARCEACRAYEAEQVRERSALEDDPRSRDALERLRARAAAAPRARTGRVRPTWLGALGALAAGTAVVLLWSSSSTTDLVAKGSDVFTVYVHRPAGVVPLGARCAPGDRLIAAYRTSRPYLLVVERDGRGAVQVLFPPAGTGSARVPTAEGTTPASWVLDAVSGTECFAAFFSDEPLAAAAAGQALASPRDAPALPGVTARVVCCEKGGTE
jgi:hypothetical protein